MSVSFSKLLLDLRKKSKREKEQARRDVNSQWLFTWLFTLMLIGYSQMSLSNDWTLLSLFSPSGTVTSLSQWWGLRVCTGFVSPLFGYKRFSRGRAKSVIPQRLRRNARQKMEIALSPTGFRATPCCASCTNRTGQPPCRVSCKNCDRSPMPSP